MEKQPKTIFVAKKKTLKKKKDNEIFVGEKIRDLKIDLNINLFILSVLLIVFNCVLIISALMLAHWIDIWWVWLIDIIISIFCVAHSVNTFFANRKNYKFSLHKNCLVLNSMWYYNTKIDYSLIRKINTKIGFWDKAFGRGTCSLVIYLKDDLRTRINLYFLKEDPVKLYNELTEIFNIK